MARKLFTRELDGVLPNWLTDEQKERCYCDDRGWVLVHPDGSEEVIVAGHRYNNPDERGHGFDAQRRSKDPDRAAAHGELSYTLIPSKTTVGEGDSVSVQLVATGVPDETLIAYTIEGIDPEDLDNGLLSGEFQIFGETATIEIPIKADRTTETLETFTLKLADDLGSVQINIDDLSKTPIYNLSSNPQSPVDEGDSLQIILETENVDDGLVAYSVEGVDELDIERGSSEILTVKVEQNLQEPFNNIFNISGNQYPNLKLFQGHTYTLNQDDNSNSSHPLLFSETNGGAEYTEGVTYYLDGIQVQDSSAYTSGFSAASSREIKISVTENTPNTLYYYCLYHNNMGSSISILADSALLAGNFSLVNGYASLVFNIKKDQLTEETPEKLILRLSDNLGTIEVDINDTSKTPSYNLSTENDITEFDEGSPIVVNLSTTNVEPGTLIPYEISGSSNLAEDFDPPFTSSTGNFIVGQLETLTFNVKEDKSWGEGDKTLRVELTGLGESVFVIIRDSSIADPVYELVADKTSVNENESFQITLNATNVPANTQIGYTLSGSANLNTDFDEVMSETGTFTVGHDTQANSSDSITFNVKDDKTWTSEGDETLILTLDGGLGTITVNIVDSSIADPVYELIAPQSSSENSSFQITLNATNVPANTQIGYTLSGSVDLNTDFDEVMSQTGFFTVGSDTQANSSDSLTFNVKDDKTWAEGDENLILTLDGGLGTVTVNITDSSIAGSSYELVANPVNVNEGDALTITLNATNVPANTQIGYTLSGSVDLNTDFDEVVPSSGSFTVGSDTQANSSDSITFNVKDDKTWAEGDENLILTLDGGLGTVTVNITDSSIADPVYELVADKTSVNENESFQITLNATNVPANTQIGYTLSGSVDLNTDFDEVMSQTGFFTVGSDTQANSSDSLTFNVRSDSSFEEGDEELTLTLDGGLGAVTVSITDSSRAIPTFGLSSNPLNQASEGGPITISLTYQNVSVGTEIGYNLTGSTVNLNTDFDPPVSNTGKFIIGQKEEVTFNIVADESFEEGNEVLKLTLDNGKASIQVPIIDSSTATPSYNLSTSGDVTFVNENDSVTISLGYQNLSVGTEVPYTISGDVDLNDFTPPLESYNGKFVIGDPLTEKVDLFLADDKTFDEGDEILTLTLDGVNEAKSIVVKDTSRQTEVYGLSAPASTNENASFSISLNTQFVTAGTEVPYTLSGNYEPEDFNPPLTSSTGTFIVGEDDTLTLSVADDKTWAENNESLTLTLDGKGISVEVDIVDSSIADPVYELVASPSNVNEGEALTITLNATNVPANTTIGYSIDAVGGGISLTDDFDSVVSPTGSFTVGHDTLANSSDSITFNLKEDKLTETSAESLILTLDGGLGSVTVPIADTSKTEIFTLESSAVNDTIGEGGDPLVITLTTQNVPDGTYAYTIQGIDESDLNLANSDQLQGSFVLVGGTDTITLDIKADALTEIPNDVIDLSLSNGKASIQITVEDTSKTPVYDLSSSPQFSVNEGVSLRIELQTTNVSETSIPYTVENIEPEDLDPGSALLTGGSFNLDSNGYGYLDFHIKADKVTEGDEELTLTLDGGLGTISVNVVDSSKTPIWELTTSPATSVNEGSDLLITLNTQNVDAGDYAYNISGSGFGAEDLDDGSSPLSGVFSVSGVSYSETLTLKIKKDYSSGEADETITISLPDVAEVDDIDVVIKDSSSLGGSSNELIEYNSEELHYSAISADGQYLAYSSASAIHVFEKNGSSWSHSTSINDSITNTQTPIDMNDDGSLLIISNPYGGVLKIYRRQGDGTYTQEASFSGSAAAYYGWYSAISNDGSTVVVSESNTNSKKIFTYKYVDGSWHQFDNNLIIPIFIPNVELSNDGSNLYIAGPYESFTAVGAHYYYKYTWNGSSWTQIENQKPLNTSFGQGITGLSISNDENLLIVSSQAHNAAQTINIFDYDSDNNTWVRRVDDIIEPTGVDYPKGQGIDMSDPDSTGIVTITNYGGRTYSLPASTDKYSIWGRSSIDEDRQLTLTLFAQAIDGDVPYTIEGITDADLDIAGGSASTDGVFQVSDSVGAINLKLLEDADSLDGSLTITLDNGGASKTVIIRDITPSYDLSSNPQISVNEGVSLRIELQTTNVSETSIPYSVDVQNIQPEDFDTGSAALTGGSFNLDSNGYGYLDFHIKEDKVTEGDETFTLTLDGGLGAISVNVLDTSKEPIWNLSTSPVGNVNEGVDLLITLQTQNVDAGDYAYNITGTAGFGLDDLDDGSSPLSGVFSVSGVSYSETLTLKIKKDYSSDETDETITISLPDVAEVADVNVVINDSSTLNPTEGGRIGETIHYPTISGDGQYLTLTGITNGSLPLWKYDSGSGLWASIGSVATPRASGYYNGHGGGSFNGDGSLLAMGSPRNTQSGVGYVDIYERNGETFTLRESIMGATPRFGFGVALSDDGLTLVSHDYVTMNNETFEWSNNQWNLVDTTNSGIAAYGQIDISSDGQRLVVPSMSNIVKIYDRNGTGWDHTHTITSSRPTIDIYGAQITNNGNTVMFGDNGYNTPNELEIWDYDGTNWNQRDSNIIAPDWTASVGYNRFIYTAASEPNNGTITLVSTKGYIYNIPASTDKYSISGPSSVDEGQDLTLTLSALMPNGDVPYTISGITDADLDIAGGSASTNGVFQVVNETASITLKILEDADGLDGSLTITVDQGGENEVSKTVTINDITPIYDLSSSPQISVNEGVSLRIELQTTNVSETSIPYSVQGIQAADLDANSAALTGGSFNLDSNGYGFIDFHIKADKVTEGDENLILTLDGGLGTISINVVDTSKEPIWELTTTPVGNVDEGVDLLITLQTQNVDAGDYAYTISGSGFGVEDLDDGSSPLSGVFSVSGVSYSETLTLKIKKDYSSGEADETITISLPDVAEVDDIDVVINDSSSIDPSEGGSVSDSDLYIYPEISKDGQYLVMATESSYSAGIYKFNSTNSNWDFIQSLYDSASRYLGLGRAFSEDGSILALSDAYNNGNNIFVYERGVDGLYTLRDNFTMTNGGSEWGLALSSDGNTLVATNSSNIETFEYSNSTWSSVDSFSPNYRPYNADISSDNQTMVVANGNGSSTSSGGIVVYTRNGNSWTEQTRFKSSETHDSIRGVSMSNNDKLIAYGNFGVYSGTSKIFFFDWDGSQWVERSGTIVDTSFNGHLGMGYYISMAEPDSNGTVKLITTRGKIYNIPATLNTYSFAGPSSIDEGQDLTITLNTLGVNGDIPYTISGINDADLDIAGGSHSTNGVFQVANDTGSITLKILEDADSVPGSLTITVDQGGENEASKTVTINDITESYILTATNTIDGAINEGEPLTINLSTINVSGPVPYEVTGNYEPEDFDTGSDPFTGEFTLDQDGNSSVTFNIKADETTDGPESLTLTLTGTPNQISITINDTSIEPSSQVGTLLHQGGIPAISGDSTVISTNVWDAAIRNYDDLIRGQVRTFNRNPVDNTITERYTIPIPYGASDASTDTTKFGRENVSFNNDGSLAAISATGDGNGKVYIYEWDDANQLYDIRDEILAPESNKFGYCSLSGDGLTLIVGSSGNNKVYTYEYNTGTGDWVRDTSAEFTLPVDLSSVSISNTKNSLVVGSKSTNSVYTYNWNESNSSWDLRNGGLLNLQSEGYGDYDWATYLSLTNDGNTVVISSYNSTPTWHVWDWDSANSQWEFRFAGEDDTSGNYGPLGHAVGASGVNNGIITVLVTWKRNSGSEVRVIIIPQNP